MAKPLKQSTIINSKAPKPRGDKAKDYVDNVKFYEALIAWQDLWTAATAAGQPKPKIPDYLGHCFMMIANRMSKMHYFSGYTYVDELVDRAIETCIAKIDRFDRNQTHNPFAYFTTCCYYAFISTIANEKKQAYIKYRLLLNALTETDLMRELSVNSDAGSSEAHAHDNMELNIGHIEEVVGTFEKKNNIQHGKKRRSKAATIDALFGDA